MTEKDYTLEDLQEIVSELRGEHGCPWDKAQTHSSMKEYMMNEAKEAVEGIELYEQTGEADNLCEELGDVLFQVVFHSQLAKEAGTFTMDDVIASICKKMIRRHPHVFGEQKGEQPLSWEELKKQERYLKSLEKENGK